VHARIRELIDYLGDQRRALRAAFDAVPAARREQAPGPERWSATNIIEHIAMVEHRLAGRFATRLAEARAAGLGPELSTAPILPTLDLSALTDRTNRRTAVEAVQPTGLNADAAWRALDEATTVLRTAIVDGDGLALGTVSLPHPVFGAISLYDCVAIAGAHEARHAEQIREIADAFAIRG
jgi:hypothetical protein